MHTHTHAHSHHNTLLLFGSLRKPSMDRFQSVTHYATGISLALCLTIALLGYLTFTDRTLGNVLNNYPRDSPLLNLARLAFSVNMMLTFPLECFVARFVLRRTLFPEDEYTSLPLWELGDKRSASTILLGGPAEGGGDDYGLEDAFSPAPAPRTREPGWHAPTPATLQPPTLVHRATRFLASLDFHLTSTLLLVGASTTIALHTCNLGLVLELTGAISAIMLSFILPSACFLALSNSGQRWRGVDVRVFHALTILFGVWVMGQTVVSVVLREGHGGDVATCI
jgi:amino acid permease